VVTVGVLEELLPPEIPPKDWLAIEANVFKSTPVACAILTTCWSVAASSLLNEETSLGIPKAVKNCEMSDELGAEDVVEPLELTPELVLVDTVRPVASISILLFL
jgi:hypothetical protein